MMSKDEAQREKLSEEDEKFAYNFLTNRSAYHHHKEQMAYIGFLVQTAFLTAIITFDWKPSSVVLTLVFAVVFWLLLHLFLRWQLRLRRYAALQNATLINALLKNLRGSVQEATGSEKPANKGAEVESRHPKWWQSLIDWFWPYPSVLSIDDIDLSEYPNWYQNEFKAQTIKGTGAFGGERLVTLGSWLVLIGIIVRLTVLP